MSDIIHYSVEYLDRSNPHDCYNQHALTRSWWLSRVYLFEAKHRYGRKKNRFRVREV